MKRWFSNGLPVALGLAVIASVFGAAGSLYRALEAVRVLVTVAVPASAAQGNVQYYFKEAEQALNGASREANFSQRVQLIASARSAELAVYRQFEALLSLHLPEKIRSDAVASLGRWKFSQLVWDEIISAASQGRLQEAAALQNTSGRRAAEEASTSLLVLRKSLDEFSSGQDTAIRTALYRAFSEIAALALAAGVFVITLMWSRKSQRELVLARKRNVELVAAEQLEREHGRVLELAGRNEPLETVLDALVSLIEKQLPGTITVISVYHEGKLQEVVAPALEETYVDDLYQIALESPELNGPVYASIHSHPAWEARRPHLLKQGFACCWYHPVFSSAGAMIGTIDVYLTKEGEPDGGQIRLLERGTQLASVVIQHRQLYEQLAFQAQRDPLTELPNRRLFQDRLEHALARCARDGEELAVIMIDLDRFKQVNDLLGHRAGDSLLRQIAQRINACLHYGDTVARIGGDEFTVILNAIEGREAAEQMAETILKEIKGPALASSSDTQVSASIGISLFPEHGRDATSLVRNADLAMYHAKGCGKNGWQIYAAELGAVFRKRMSIERNLENALAGRELEVYYQAQTDPDRQLAGFEALVRWNNPAVGVVSPEVFIPVAEESGLILPIGGWVMQQACIQSAAWLASGHAAPRVAVNISARQLGQDDFVESVRQTLRATGLPPDHLELELTETALMKNLEDCIERLTELRQLGVTISIDDFGTGYSSLSYLQKLPVNGLKIDKSFVREISKQSRNTLPLIQAIVDLAHGLGLKVVAEGVETERQLHELRNTGCDMLQGYLLHRPQPAKAVECMLSQTASDLVRLGETLQAGSGARVANGPRIRRSRVRA